MHRRPSRNWNQAAIDDVVRVMELRELSAQARAHIPAVVTYLESECPDPDDAVQQFGSALTLFFLVPRVWARSMGGGRAEVIASEVPDATGIENVQKLAALAEYQAIPDEDRERESWRMEFRPRRGLIYVP